MTRIMGCLAAAATAVALSLLTSTALAAHAGDPSARGIQPLAVEGNPKCGVVAPGSRELTIQPVVAGTYSDGTLEVAITHVSNKRFFDWSSNLGVDAVIVKGGPNANIYRYAPEATGDGNLHAPINHENGMPYGLSHVSFCYDVEAVPPPGEPPPDEPPPAPRCTGGAFDVRLDLSGPVEGFVGPAIATDFDVFPDAETLSVLSLTVPGASQPAVTATTLTAQNTGDPSSACRTNVTYESLNVDLRHHGIPLTLGATALQTTAEARPGGASSQVVIVGLAVNGVNVVVSPAPNTTALDLGLLGVPGLAGTVVLHEQTATPGGVDANAIRVQASFTDPVLGATQSADLRIAHAEAGVSAS